MRIKDLQNYKCIVSNDVIIDKNDLANICEEEQECHFNIDKFEQVIHVCCSYQKYITKLAHSPLFSVKRILISTNTERKGHILQITGYLPIRALTIRNMLGGEE